MIKYEEIFEIFKLLNEFFLILFGSKKVFFMIFKYVNEIRNLIKLKQAVQ